MRTDLRRKLGMVLATAVVALGASACSERFLEPPPLGGSVEQNKAAQTVNAKPVDPAVAPPLNGERDALALTRYEEGKVIRPKNINTTGGAVRTGGSGSGGN